MSEPFEFQIELRVAEAIAREAGHRIVEGSRRALEVEYKAPHDVVTHVDRATEEFVSKALREAFPSDAFFGEEHGVKGEASRRWVVDPIDGTLNFSRGLPVYCVSIALQVDGESVVGVIFDPTRDELFSAAKGHGARLNGAPTSVADPVSLEDSVLATGFLPMSSEDEEDNLEHFVALSHKSRNIRRLGSAALDLAYVACGRLDGFWEFHLNPWDTAAGYLLVKESGGLATDLDGEAYTGYQRCVVAAGPALHPELMTALKDVGGSA